MVARASFENSPMPPGRIFSVTLSIALLGAIIGASLGALVLALWALVWALRDLGSLALGGALVGSLLGLVLAPITAWAFLRRVAIGRALTHTAIGTALGAFAGLAVGGRDVRGALQIGLIGALIGFVAAAIELRIVTRNATPVASRQAGPE